MHRRRSFLLALPMVVVFASCSGASASYSGSSPSTRVAPVQAPARPAATAVATDAVSIRNFAFSPSVVTVPVGTTVTWTNADVEQHTVTARDRSFNSDAVASDKSFAFTFDKAGSFDYFCQIHPQMVGLVVVTDR